MSESVRLRRVIFASARADKVTRKLHIGSYAKVAAISRSQRDDATFAWSLHDMAAQRPCRHAHATPRISPRAVLYREQVCLRHGACPPNAASTARHFSTAGFPALASRARHDDDSRLFCRSATCRRRRAFEISCATHCFDDHLLSKLPRAGAADTMAELLCGRVTLRRTPSYDTP